MIEIKITCTRCGKVAVKTVYGAGCFRTISDAVSVLCTDEIRRLANARALWWYNILRPGFGSKDITLCPDCVREVRKLLTEGEKMARDFIFGGCCHE